ncbi:MAG: dynamin family protein [Desulfococcaceae bacterium]|jgi:GTPase SAR1 family protein|nr:dynamin family protein [Desulfococcaceae bacterium]
MMHNYKDITKELLKTVGSMDDLTARYRAASGAEDPVSRNWQKNCENIREQVSEEMLRVAVVGAIKSGKSTFVNSLFKDDYLKRGAGVVTSIVTRIRKGEGLRARLWFKSWDTVNKEMKRSLLLFPAAEWPSEQKDFDIRREEDRQELEKALSSLHRDKLISNDSRSTDSVLLSSYLKGYERVKDIIAEEEVTLEYSGAEFEKHKDYSGNDDLALWLRDIELEIRAPELADKIEIADCQGSDSPNPLHLVMIQNYLLMTHLIVYVISSRTGLRQADIRFLTAIRKMGIMENTLFLVNFDFGDHDSREDLEKLLEKIREEIALICPDPNVFALSALFNLFKEKEKDLSVKDRLRFAHWKGELGLAEYSARETKRFHQLIQQKLTQERYVLLLKNHVERLHVISAGLRHRISLNRDLLQRDASGVGEMLESIRRHQEKTLEIRSMIRSTLDGAVRKIQQTLRTDTDRFFDCQYGICAETIRFLENFHVPYPEYGKDALTSGFNHMMYMLFQEIRAAVDTFMAENVNPEVIRFLREEEEKIREHFITLAAPYDVMVQDALREYNRSMEAIGISPLENTRMETVLPDTEHLREEAGVRLPRASSSMNYTATIRSEAVMRLGFFQMIAFFRKIFKKPLPEGEAEMQALKGGVSRLKKETRHSLLFHFKDFRENIKFQYLFRLTNALADRICDNLCEQFGTYAQDLSKIRDMVSRKQEDKDRILEALEGVENMRQEIQKGLAELKKNIEKILSP